MKPYLMLLGLFLLLTACSKGDDHPATPIPEPTGPAHRTVIVYMAAENSISGYVQRDINEMLQGRKLVSASENLVIFVDRASDTEKPFIAKVTTNSKHPLDTLYQYDQDFYVSDPSQMTDVLDRCIQFCPATEDYGLVLWGHANGWIVEDDSIAIRRAYGIDNGRNKATDNGKWLNIPSMRESLQMLPVKWKFILFDCCNMMNVETAFELKDLADYLIGSPAEIPALGAPYQKVVPDMFLRTEDFYKNIIDDYATSATQGLPLSVIKTGRMAALAQSTRPLLRDVNTLVETTGLSGHIYYYNDYKNGERTHIMYDIKEVVRKALGSDMTRYGNWLASLNEAVPYSRMSKQWTTNSTIAIDFNDFTVSEENFSGVSMFFPMAIYNTTSHTYNDLVKKLSWYYAVGWSEVGW